MIVLAAGTAGLLAACSSGGSSPSTQSSSPGSTSSPLTIGLSYADNGAAVSAVGASTGTSVTSKSAAQALVRGINAAGGLAGRKLVAVEYGFNLSDNQYGTDAQAACTKFSQDSHVSVVLDNAFGIDAGFRDCLQQAGVMDITSGDEGGKSTSQQAPLHANPAVMTRDRSAIAQLTLLTGSGYLTTSNQLGVIVEGCPEDNVTYSQTIVPLAGRLGLKTPKEAQFGCVTGFASAGPAAAAMQSAVLAFHNAGVDRVMFVSGYSSIVSYLFAKVAASQRYKPGYLLDSWASPQQVRSQFPATQQPQIHGVGDYPASDTDSPTATPVDNRCLHLAQVGGVTPASTADRQVVYSECSTFLLLEAALTKTHGASSAKDLQTAIGALGTSFTAPGVLEGSTDFSAERFDGPNRVQIFAYESSCGCLRYSGSPAPAPS